MTSYIPTVQNQAQAGNLAPHLQKCIVVHKAVPDKEQTNSLLGPKVQVLPAVTAAAKGEEIEQPKIVKPEELVNSSDNSASFQSSSQIPQKLSNRVEELKEVPPQPACLESLVRQIPSKPKNAAIAGTIPSPEVKTQEISAKETPATCTEQMDTGSRAFKRKSEIPEEALMTPEKQLHVTEKCPTRLPFQGPLQRFPIAPTPKVPPLRVKEPYVLSSFCNDFCKLISSSVAIPVTIVLHFYFKSERTPVIADCWLAEANESGDELSLVNSDQGDSAQECLNDILTFTTDNLILRGIPWMKRKDLVLKPSHLSCFVYFRDPLCNFFHTQRINE